MRKFEKWLPLAVFVAGILAYANSLSGVFLFDDRLAVVGNPEVMRILPLQWGPRVWVELAFSIDYALGGDSVIQYHITNLLIHLCAGLALFGIVRRVLRRPFFGGCYLGSAPWLAAAASALWVLHPLQTESVTYICQRYEATMGLFWLLAFYFFVRGYEVLNPWRWWCASAVTFVLGLGTKEVIVTFPAVALVYDHMFEGGAMRRCLVARWRVAAVLAVLALVAVFPVLRVMVEGILLQQRGASVSRWTYLATQCGVIVHYLRLAFWPAPLCLDYAWPAANGWREAAMPAVVVAALLGATAWGTVRRCSVAFAGVWFFVVLAPTSSVFPIDDMAFEHRMYLPLAACAVFFVLLLYRGMRLAVASGGVALKVARLVTVVLILASCCLMGLLTVRRNRDYGSEVRMWRRTLEVRPNNLRAGVSLGAALLADGKARDAEDILLWVLSELPTAATGAGYSVDDVRAKALSGLGVIRERAGEPGEAEELFRRALAIEPAFARARNNLGIVLEKQGRIDEARAEWREVVRRSGADQEARLCLATSFLRQGKYAQAKAEFEAMRMVGPKSVRGRMAFAWLLATCPDSALRDGERAAVLLDAVEPQHPVTRVRVHDIRGAAFAAAGRYEDALTEAGKALELARELDVTGMDAVERRLELYRAGRPFVETKQPRR